MAAKWALLVAVLAFAWLAQNVTAKEQLEEQIPADSDDDYLNDDEYFDFNVDIEDRYIVVLKNGGPRQEVPDLDGDTARRVEPLPVDDDDDVQLPGDEDVKQWKSPVDPRAFVERVISDNEWIADFFEPDQVYESVINGFSARITSPRAIEKIISYDEVEYIEAEKVFSTSCPSTTPPPPPPPPPPASWGLDRVDERNLPLDGTNPPVYQGAGSGVHIYVIDTGTSKKHNEFSGRFDLQGYNVYGGTIGKDCHGHGTHVAGTAAGATYGVANKAIVHSVRVLNCQGYGSTSGILSGMNWVATYAKKPAVATMSLGTNSVSPSINAAVGTLTNKGIVVTVAAGNENRDACNVSPASAPMAITVGATDISDRRAPFSNYGDKCLDIFAPGVRIKSAWKVSWFPWFGYRSRTNTLSGTSMACPHVAGAAAILLGLNPSLSPAQVEAKLIALSTKNKVSDPKGSPNRLLYIGN